MAQNISSVVIEPDNPLYHSITFFPKLSSDAQWNTQRLPLFIELYVVFTHDGWSGTKKGVAPLAQAHIACFKHMVYFKGKNNIYIGMASEMILNKQYCGPAVDVCAG